MDMEIGLSLSLSSIALLMGYTMSTDKLCHTHTQMLHKFVFYFLLNVYLFGFKLWNNNSLIK